MKQQAAQRFGGPWTKEKLSVLQRYLQAYTRALKRTPFELWYIDAFAGTGYIAESEEAPVDSLNLPGMEEGTPVEPLEGSAKMALRIDPPFHRYIFMDMKRANICQLAMLRDEFSALSDRIDIVRTDCNQYIQDFCRKTDWSRKRAVVFLDPFGMQVDWATMQAIAQTKAIDVWNLFPVGLGAARVLVRSGKVPQEWRPRLHRVFGTTGWEKDLYVRKTVDGLYGEEHVTERVRLEEIAAYYLDRLKSIFAAVDENPRKLLGGKSTPLFYFFFAVSNPDPKAKALAMKIAGSIKGGKVRG